MAAMEFFWVFLWRDQRDLGGYWCGNDQQVVVGYWVSRSVSCCGFLAVEID